MYQRIRTYLEAPLHIAPLATFRVLFGGIMFVSVLRFILKGWVTELYVQPQFYFSYSGFEWVQPLGAGGMYAVFIGMAVAALLIMLGLYYRVAAPAFLLSFTYVELLDKTNYLNHYYFVSIVAFLLVLVPAHAWMSLDVRRRPELQRTAVPRWMVGIFRLQMGLVYSFAGIAKLNSDWLLRAMPMRIWLPAQAHLPLIGGLLKLKAVAFIFSWLGAAYDLFIPALLLWRRSRPLAYVAVIAFHAMTALLFQIGMFPWIMMLCSLVFFPADVHAKAWGKLGRIFPKKAAVTNSKAASFRWGGVLRTVLVAHFVIQMLLPFRYLAYGDDLFWHEQGYRFSWRVMLMEKAGYATFTVRDPESGGSSEITNSDYLTPNQEKMMATQPDMLLQFAHHLAADYQQKGIHQPEIYAHVYVTLNGSGSRPFVNSTLDLSKISTKGPVSDWILPFQPQPLYSHQQ